VIAGIGVDLVDVPRMERLLSRRSAERFISRVFCAEEIAVSQRAPHPAEAYAARFAAKEALVKALGTGFSRGISPGQIHMVGGERSKPFIELAGAARQKAHALHVVAIHVSVTHTPASACAMVVLESETHFSPQNQEA
jgi:holo-[acyl-carrier protein] synthase